ncbi:hypothetical protein EV356DRAFT_535001 [Viridothelium virens]|uniref:Uncharacterized protein n=1 Tax=Viridothelium virens TaxID=1048519 RepID=A0A6A6H2U0_VIRVR|nr:hypothetical protein EV356DRAFT_535001 [Viridothelium virens]
MAPLSLPISAGAGVRAAHPSSGAASFLKQAVQAIQAAARLCILADWQGDNGHPRSTLCPPTGLDLAELVFPGLGESAILLRIIAALAQSTVPSSTRRLRIVLACPLIARPHRSSRSRCRATPA